MSINLEEYKQIPNSFHYVNKKGEILNKFNKKVKPRNVNGYFALSVCKNKQKKELYIHRIVAELFLPNPYNLPEVHHKNNDKSNNNVDNLEWTTKSMNCRMSSKTKKSGLPRGVSYNKVAKKYQVQISINCKIKHLGYFTDIEEAHKVYLDKYKEIMGIDCVYS